MLKSSFYNTALPSEIDGIVSERNPEKHRATRRLLSHAFSAKALRDQTTVVVKYVDMFVDQIHAKGTLDGGIDMTEASCSICVACNSKLDSGITGLHSILLVISLLANLLVRWH